MHFHLAVRCGVLIVSVAAIVSAADCLIAADWPTFRHDNRRSATGQENIDPAALREQWALRSDGPPQTAWGGPAKWDAYARISGLRSMRNYDRAFGVAVVAQSVFVASSADDSVTCLDLATGAVRWRFWTDGPVRITPTVTDNRVFFGSDDGNAYCISAVDGKLLWKYHPPNDGPLILHNGRMISNWPCRTGVLVDGGTAYCAFSMFPWQPSFLSALDAATGKPIGDGRYETRIDRATIEGAMAISASKIFAPQGRVSPLIVQRANGRPLGALEGGGGSFVAIGPDDAIYHGPGNKTGWVTISDPRTRKPMATHKGCNATVVVGQATYDLSDNQVTRVVTGSTRIMWKADVPSAHEMIVNGDTVFVGGRDEVVALHAENGTRLWDALVSGDACLVVVAGGALLVSTDEGAIHCFRPEPGHVGEARADVTPTRSEKPPLRKSDSEPKQPAAPSASRRLLATKVPGTVGHWAFHTGMSDQARRRGLEDAKRRVVDLAGSLDGTIVGEVNLRQSGGIEALLFDGRSNSVMLTEDHGRAGLPKQQITAEAWVRVDAPLQWGGIIGAFQDNGDFERGWVLGYRGSKFCFAVNGTGGENRLTYLDGTTEFQKDAWYHVVGTYDGTTQRIFVNGAVENTSTVQQGDIQYPPQAFYEIGAYHDKDEYARLTGMVHEVRVYSRSLGSDEVREHHDALRQDLPKPIQLVAGPYSRFLDGESVEIIWQTEKPSTGLVVVGDGGEARRVSEDKPSRDHRIQIDGLKRNRVYLYRIRTGPSEVTPPFELDTTFNFTRAMVPDRPNPFASGEPSNASRRAAATILAKSGVSRGICLVLGAEDGQMTSELVRQSDLVVIGVETDPTKVAKARRALTAAGIYGHRATIHHVESLSKLPYTGDFANLVVSDGMLNDGEVPCDIEEVQRVLRPNGGIAMFGQPTGAPQNISAARLRQWSDLATGEVTTGTDGVWARWARQPLAGAGEWSHLYGAADNSAYGGELLGGARAAEDLRVQWLGRPGPRAQPDRNGRKPSPLSTNGRLFVQGLHRLIGLDAYNGTILWSLEIPPLQRFNVPRDCGNWCADDDHVFVAIKDACWQINAQTGRVKSMHAVQPGDREDWSYDWSYVARHNDKLIGSAVKSGSAYVEFWGGADAGWYDAQRGPVTYKVCSENLFARDVTTGDDEWTYTGGVIINSTISVAAGKIYFVECRHPVVKQSESRRVGIAELWEQQYLVSLDVDTGRVLWERPLAIAAGIVTFYMAHGSDKLVIAASGDKKYDVNVYDAANGDPVWRRDFGWPGGKGDHGKAMSRPAIAGDRLYVRPQVFNLQTGDVVAQMPGGGCGTYALTANTAIFRNGNVTLWDGDSGKATSWDRLRPGCWLSTIPAAGMLLSPEAGGGCSCGKWIETSIGFIPSLNR